MEATQNGKVDNAQISVQKNKAVLPLFCKTTYIFLLLEFTSPFDIA
jgi:hypothetical protein